jgi:hypothetical protein
LSLFLVTILVRTFVSGDSGARILLDWLGTVTLGWWGLCEVMRGVNPWRRALGMGGCAFAVAALVALVY